jgi:hypothetical protein
VKKERLKYSQLCEKFSEEEKPRGTRRDRQFERWRREWNIERDGNTYYYLVSPLTMKQKQLDSNIVNFSSKDLIEAMVYDLLHKSEGKYLDTTKLEQQELLGLINNQFKLTLIEPLKEANANELEIPVEKIEDFTKEVYALNNVTINNVKQGMVKKGYINVEKIFKVKYDSGHSMVENNFVSITGDKMQEIENYRNELTRKITNNRLTDYYSIRDKNLRDQVIQALNKHFGFEQCFDGERWWLDKQSIEFILAKNYSYILNKIKVNENNQLKISKSTRGELKNLDTISKNKMIKKTIELKKGDKE